MQHAGTESDFARKLGGSAKELQDEEERHAIECKATHGLIGTGNLRAHEQKSQVFLKTRVLRWITAVYISIARWLYERSL